jgi:hypothetical protein
VTDTFELCLRRIELAFSGGLESFQVGADEFSENSWQPIPERLHAGPLVWHLCLLQNTVLVLEVILLSAAPADHCMRSKLEACLVSDQIQCSGSGILRIEGVELDEWINR